MHNFTFAVTSANFQEQVLNSTIPVLVDFTAGWCPPCKMMAPLVENIAQKYSGQLAVGVVNDETDPEIGSMYDVQGLPTLLLFQNGEAVKRLVGFRPQKQLEDALTPYLNGVPSTTAD